MDLRKSRKSLWLRVYTNWELYLFLLPALACIILFSYMPMYGVQIAFKSFNARLGITNSPWAGFKYFDQFFGSPVFKTTLTNTLVISVYSIIFGFPIPILFALFLNHVPNKRFMRFIQTTTYAPYFISTVVLVSMLNIFLAPNSGFINNILAAITGKVELYTARAESFRAVYTISGIWQTMGWNAIIYIAALTNIDSAIHEAATIDGASKLRRIFSIDLPGIMPTIVILLVLSIGNIMSVGYEKAFLMQRNMNLTTSELVSTYSYKIGLQNAQYSFASAIGLFNSVINVVILTASNFAAKKISGYGLW
jgi:putative aldouronate transport system permease protein